MLKRLRDELSEKTKLIVYISITVLVFITSCLLPLAFRSASDTNAFDNGEKAALFLQYKSNSKDIKSTVLDTVSGNDAKFCQNRMTELKTLCRIDKKTGRLITEGYEYTIISDGEKNLRLCRMWIQDEGDWTNWMDVYFDMDSGFVYYLYVSSICLSNATGYFDALEDGFNTKRVAEMFSKKIGSGLKHFSWSGKAEDAAYAVTSENGDTLCWSINCTYYPSTMLDIKISVA